MSETATLDPQTRSGSPDDRELSIVDPRNGSPVGRMRMSSREEVRAAVASAREAFPAWAARSPEERGRALREVAAVLRSHEDELAGLNERETGRPREEALDGIRAGCDTLLQYAEIAPLHAGRRLLGAGDAIDYSIPEPRGVVAVVTPWNDPVAVALGLVGAAVAVGDTVVHKPSERCPHLGARLTELVASALPSGVVVPLVGDASVGAALVEEPAVAMVAHVGSTRAGLAIATAAAPRGVHVVRENGGNDALVVDADVDPVWAAQQAAIGAFTNVGQLCTSVERVYVHRAVAAPFLEALVAEAERRNASGTFPPLVDDRLRRLVHDQVASAVREGATPLVGGAIPDGPGSHYPATVLTGCRRSMTIMCEETFGPVAPVQVVDDFEDGLEEAASDRYGLSATVLTASIAHATLAARRLPVGTVKVNAVFGGAPGGSAQPRGDSGSGYGYGPRLLDEMTTTKVVHLGSPEALA